MASAARRRAGPVADAAGPRRPRPAMDVTSPPRRRAGLAEKRVLVVEDNAIVAMLVEDELSGAGAKVVAPPGPSVARSG